MVEYSGNRVWYPESKILLIFGRTTRYDLGDRTYRIASANLAIAQTDADPQLFYVLKNRYGSLHAFEQELTEIFEQFEIVDDSFLRISESDKIRFEFYLA